MTQFSYTVTHITSGNTNITNYVEEIECVDTGTGEVKSAKLTLNALLGKFLVSSPILAQFDQIKISIIDEDSTEYVQIYEVDRIIPIKNAGEGYKVEVECLGQEHHLQKVDFARQFYFSSAQNATEGICDFYNDTIGSSQPTIQNHDTTTAGNNELPRWTANNYEFAISETKVYDGLMEIVEGLGASVAAGGAGDFFELYFDSNTADPTLINFQAFASGAYPTAGNEITITDAVAVNVAPAEGGIDMITGTLVKAWGSKGYGTLPNSVQDFAGELEAFNLHPYHVSGVTYPSGARVQLNGTHYEANTETSQTPPHANWTSIVFSDIQGSSTGYSLWTDGKQDEWISSGSDPANTATGGKGLGCWDSNLVINDGTYFQTWVHKKSTTDNFDVNYKYGAAAGGAYRGLRVLVNGTGLNGFSSTDANGKSFSGNIAEYDGSQWLVKYETSNSWRCAVRDEGRVYEKQSGTWTDISGNARENHCFHIVTTVQNVAGYNSTDNGAGGTYGDASAVQWTYTYTAFDTIPAGLFTSDGFYKIGAWANFSLPFPENSYNSNTLGQLYGNNATKKEPVTIDTKNMHLTPSGNVGFNNSEAETLGPLDGIQFWMKFNWTDIVGQTLQGDFKMRCTMYDTSDNVVIQEFVIPFNNLWEPVKLPFSGFKPYRARIPMSLGNIAPNLFTEDLEVLNVFQWTNIKLISFQWQEVYDNEGRYAPEGSRAITGAFAGTATIKLAIDGFCFTKPLLAVTSPDTTRALEPRSLNYPDVSNSVQLSQIANSQKEIENFQHKEFTITTAGKNDIAFGDTFFLNDSLIINDNDTRTADTGGSANTIRLVAKRITYKISKNDNGAGNFLRTILGIKRLLT